MSNVIKFSRYVLLYPDVSQDSRDILIVDSIILVKESYVTEVNDLLMKPVRVSQELLDLETLEVDCSFP